MGRNDIYAITKLSTIRLSVYLLVFIQFLFLYKYGERFAELGILVSGLIAMVSIIAWYLLRQNNKVLALLERFNPVLIGMILISLALLLTDTSALNVDRYSVVDAFWNAAVNGEYPYLAKSHMNNFPGPMPFYFFILFPFWWIGDIGTICLVLIVVWFYFRKWNFKNFAPVMVLLILLAPFWWEVIARSNVFFNSLLMVIALNLLQSKRWWMAAVSIGLVMSMRTIFMLPLITSVILLIRSKQLAWKDLMWIGSIAGFVFGLTFLPIVLGHWTEFLEMNPFVVQSSFLIPPYYILVFMAISVGLGLYFKPKNHLFANGLSLFLPIFIYFIYHSVLAGLQGALHNSQADISYFIFCIPFFTEYLLDNQVN